MKAREAWFLEMRGRGLSEETLRNYDKALRFFGTGLKGRPFESAGAVEFKSHFETMSKRLNEESLQHHFNNLHVFYGWLYKTGRIHRDLRGFIPRVRTPRKILKKVPRIGEVKKILLSPDINLKYGFRDRTLLILSYAGALRRKEVVGLDLKDVDRREKTIHITRKGGHAQEVPVGALAFEYLELFIDSIRPRFKNKGDHVFPSYTGRRLLANQLTIIFKRHARAAGYEAFSHHSLRHAAASHMLASGAEIRDIQAFLGHKDLGSTAIYTRVEESGLREAVERLSF